MYRYTTDDQNIVNERVAQFREQTDRYLRGELTDAEYLPLRLQNGLYVQRHAPMLRVAIPYGVLSSIQTRMLAQIARRYDKGYAHLTTRQNIQYNWPKLEMVPDILADLATVQMHAIQTSGNCLRNTTSDEYAGVQAEEIEDPRPYCELIRQWSTLHPEFAFLPRKFKIAVTAGTQTDRAAIQVHDIGVQLVKNEAGAVGFKISVGGGLGRTPLIGQVISEFVEKKDLLSYLECILRVYNRFGRRDNKYKARIKILVKALGIEAFRARVETQWASMRESKMTVPEAELERLKAAFAQPEYTRYTPEAVSAAQAAITQTCQQSTAFAQWYNTNTAQHKVPGYRIVTLSVKQSGMPPGDLTSDQLDAVADLADTFGFGEVRVTHQQNLVLPHVTLNQLPHLWEQLKDLGLATPNIGKLTDMICCPGGDFCSLANAKSIPVAAEIQAHFEQQDYLYDLGDIDLNISGCMNACGHHHVGNIGILGVDKKGREFYQISIGGSAYENAKIGQILGPSFERDDVVNAIDKIITIFLQKRIKEESFYSVVDRLGIEPFREAVYADAD
jgi:sulfite reductase (NADPH) hemoprotein beta-component